MLGVVLAVTFVGMVRYDLVFLVLCVWGGVVFPERAYFVYLVVFVLGLIG